MAVGEEIVEEEDGATPSGHLAKSAGWEAKKLLVDVGFEVHKRVFGSQIKMIGADLDGTVARLSQQKT